MEIPFVKVLQQSYYISLVSVHVAKPLLSWTDPSF